MTDLGLLSHQYHELTELSQRIRQWAMQVKRSYYDLPAPDSDNTTTLTFAREKLARVLRFLSEVVKLDDQSLWPEEWLNDPPLPSSIVDRLRIEHKHERGLYAARLEKLAAKLAVSVDELSERDLLLLDTVVMATSADANEVFRRLMRWS